MTTTTEKPGLIFKQIPAIMLEIPSIGKDRKNTGQGYNFRGIDDIYNFVQPLLAKHSVFMTAEILDDRHEERQSKSGGVIMYRVLKMRYSFVAADGSSVATDAVGEGMDSGDKASAKAMSIAQKYAILQMFLVPTEEPKDPEIDNHEVAPKAKPAPAPVELVTDGQRVVLAKLLDDMQRAGKDVDDIVEKVKAHFGIDGYPGELTKDQAAALIKKWSDGLKKAAK
jgi:hypothetical protein